MERNPWPLALSEICRPEIDIMGEIKVMAPLMVELSSNTTETTPISRGKRAERDRWTQICDMVERKRERDEKAQKLFLFSGG